LYRCIDCFGSPVQCGHCFHKGHRLLPFHAVEKWNGSSFQELPLLAHQLMRSRLFPSTFTRPTVAYTFELMSHWHLGSLQSKKSTWDYWQAVCQKTKRGAQRQGYHAFLRAGRYWRVLKMQQRAGQALGIDKHLPENRWPGSVVMVCPACPEPEFNLQPTWR
ncbi:hypothetical protein AURDEDRAFT_41587, partial [Auricularia subglabra TFB-10046 SS5]